LAFSIALFVNTIFLYNEAIIFGASLQRYKLVLTVRKNNHGHLKKNDHGHLKK